jgi:hypothetical protein
MGTLLTGQHGTPALCPAKRAFFFNNFFWENSFFFNQGFHHVSPKFSSSPDDSPTKQLTE